MSVSSTPAYKVVGYAVWKARQKGDKMDHSTPVTEVEGVNNDGYIQPSLVQEYCQKQPFGGKNMDTFTYKFLEGLLTDNISPETAAMLWDGAVSNGQAFQHWRTAVVYLLGKQAPTYKMTEGYGSKMFTKKAVEREHLNKSWLESQLSTEDKEILQDFGMTFASLETDDEDE